MPLSTVVKEKGIDQDEDGVIQSQELADILDVIVPEISEKYVSEVQIPHNFVLGKDFSLFSK